MKITEFHARRFRNLANLEWSPSDGLNLICGDNGQGKTNLLEAIYMALLGRSFRTRREDECLAWREPEAPAGNASGDENAARVEAALENAAGPSRRTVTLARGHKRVEEDGALVDRLARLWKSSPVVSFTPADVDLFRDAPARRRRFIDQLLSRLSPIYLDHLQRYNRALRQTNAALRSDSGSGRSREQAEAYYPVLAASAAILIEQRGRCLAALGEIAADLHEQLGGPARLELGYASSIQNDAPGEATEEEFAKGIRGELAARHAESERIGSVAVGPHRDNLRAGLGGRDLAKFGSQGQHRLVALAIKLGSAELLDRDLKDPPVLLLDDFGSELDATRRERVLAGLRGRMQTFVTATHVDDLGPFSLFDEVRPIRAGGWAS